VRQISCVPRYIQKPSFMCQIFREQRTFGNSRFPFTLARPEALNYDPQIFLSRWRLSRVSRPAWNENYTDEHVDYIATAIHQSLDALKKN